jgi:hypothetical protein
VADIQEPSSTGEGKHGIARHLVDASMQAQRDGRLDEADRLMDEAVRTDPQAVEDALLETRQGARLDAAEIGTDAEVAAITRTIQPGSDAPSRAGITGSGSGADG